ncbi:signal recognition particle-docking protein FtsY [Candidatus Woesearchaeota archaeon]|nr:signal recognition particle-docking protein FtsY [Candidatus Woesearchaeota archaeon]
MEEPALQIPEEQGRQAQRQETKDKAKEKTHDLVQPEPEISEPSAEVQAEKVAEITSEPEVTGPPDKLVSDQEVGLPEPEPPKKEKKNLFGAVKPRYDSMRPDADLKAERKTIMQKLREKITTKKLSEEKFEELFFDLEVVLLENNVAVEVIDKIKYDLKRGIVNIPIPRTKVMETIRQKLKGSVEELFEVEGFNLTDKVREAKPYVICFIGVNGSGKTTTLAKTASLLQEKGLKVVMAAGDTFRAAAIQQLEEHANRLKTKLIKHDYGADAAAVAFDAIKFAQAKDYDVVLIDTAGRLQSNTNLMDELKKVVRVSKPNMKIFVGESITGNDCIEQAKKFKQEIGIDAIILAKADVDEKGGTAVSVSYVTRKPIIYLGTGQEYKDLVPFEPGIVVQGLGL